MVRFDPAPAFEHEIRSSDRIGEAPAAAARRRSRKGAKQAHEPFNPLAQSVFPSWARLPAHCAVDPNAGSGAANVSSGAANSCAAFSAGAGLALLDAILRENPPFAGALSQRLALRAAVSCARIARLREDASALRDAEHLAPNGEATQTSPAGRIHRLWRLSATRPLRLDASTLRTAAQLVGLPDGPNFDGLAEAMRNIASNAEHPLAAAAGVSAAAMKLLTGAPLVDAEIFALWLADLALATRLGWAAPVPLLATAIAHPSLRRGPAGKRPRPGDPDWADALVRAYALAAREAYALAVELTRRSQSLLASAPKLRAEGAGRVVELLLSDDAVSPARAAKTARLSDRAARRLFDRLIELGAARELSGRPNFRLYGL